MNDGNLLFQAELRMAVFLFGRFRWAAVMARFLPVISVVVSGCCWRDFAF
jgi:hypothetical protein